MKYIDPSGYLWKKLKGFVKKYWKPIVAIGFAIVTGDLIQDKGTQGLSSFLTKMVI